MALHNGASYQDGQAFDSTATYHDLMERYLLVKTPDPSSRGHPQADFGHLCAGYDAGYYSYLWQGAPNIYQTEVKSDFTCEQCRSLCSGHVPNQFRNRSA